MKKWEYKGIEMGAGLSGFDEVVNKLGREGWEMVVAIPRNELGITSTIYFIFKREMRPERESPRRKR